MSNFNFDHINITTAKENKTLEFFREVLGFDNGHRPPFPFAGEWLYSGGQAIIHAITPDINNKQTQFGHVAFRGKERAEAIIERIESLGFKHLSTIVPDSGEVQIFVDLDGLTIEIITPS